MDEISNKKSALSHCLRICISTCGCEEDEIFESLPKDLHFHMWLLFLNEGSPA